MDKQQHKTKVNERVRLKKDGQDGLYPAAAAGAPGWVRKQDHDNMGYPTVFIEWDKNHWSYMGEPDRWTMEAHFEPEESTVPEQDPKPRPGIEERFAAFLEFERQNCESEGILEPEPEEPSLDDQYEESVEGATKILLESDSFIVVAVRTIDDRELVPKTVSFYKTPESGLVAEMYLSRIAAVAHEESVITEVQRIVAERKDKE